MNICDHCCAPVKDDNTYCLKCKTVQEARLATFKKISPSELGMGRAIIVWAFGDAPDAYREMSNNGGDEDWIALLPPNFEWTPFWLEKLDTCMSPQEYLIADGYKIIIGSHA